MDHVALYRERRPQLFSEVIGQEAICRTLQNSVRFGKLSHAYLFYGPRGTGKTSTARILAKAVNCASPRDGEPCNECESCRTITSGSSLDVMEMDAASNRGIDEIRDLKQRVGFVPSGGKRRVHIIDEVHMLTGEAFNALLKTLEEPPSHAIFILATTEAYKVPPTVSSRCQRFEFRRVGQDQVGDHLSQIAGDKGWMISADALALLVKHAGGAMRDAIGLLEQAASLTGGKIELADVEAITGSLDEGTLSRILDDTVNGDMPSLIKDLGEILVKGYEPRRILFQLIERVRNALFSGERNCVPEQYGQLMRSLACADTEMRGNSRPDLTLEIALVRAAGCSTGSHVLLPRPSEEAKRSPAALKSVVNVCAPAEKPVAVDKASQGGEIDRSETTVVEEKAVDMNRLRVHLLNSLIKHRVLQGVVRSCYIVQEGNAIRIKATPAYFSVLQRSENRNLIVDSLAKFGCGLPVEIVLEGDPKCSGGSRQDAPLTPALIMDRQKDLRDVLREGRQVPQGVDAADYALDVFKGKLVDSGNSGLCAQPGILGDRKAV